MSSQMQCREIDQNLKPFLNSRKPPSLNTSNTFIDNVKPLRDTIKTFTPLSTRHGGIDQKD